MRHFFLLLLQWVKFEFYDSNSASILIQNSSYYTISMMMLLYLRSNPPHSRDSFCGQFYWWPIGEMQVCVRMFEEKKVHTHKNGQFHNGTNRIV